MFRSHYCWTCPVLCFQLEGVQGWGRGCLSEGGDCLPSSSSWDLGRLAWDSCAADQETGSCPLQADRGRGVRGHKPPLSEALNPPDEGKLCLAAQQNSNLPRQPHQRIWVKTANCPKFNFYSSQTLYRILNFFGSLLVNRYCASLSNKYYYYLSSKHPN